jgi:hypothetical protein
MFALVGVGIGALVAWTYKLGAGKVDVSGRAIVAVLSVVSVALGDVVFVAWMIARERPDIGFNLAIGLPRRSASTPRIRATPSSRWSAAWRARGSRSARCRSRSSCRRSSRREASDDNSQAA